MKLHVFNPEHDIALAYNKPEITLPHNIQELKTNLGFLPALWANDGDCVLVDDVSFAIKALNNSKRTHSDILFLEGNDLKNTSFTEIIPWGWDLNIRSFLLSKGINEKILPSQHSLLITRELSSRKQTKYLLTYLRRLIDGNICGESFFASSLNDFKTALNKHKDVVVKAPWSSSGRGIRYISHDSLSRSLEGWVDNIINRQGGITVEPYYNRVKDFAVEFTSDGFGDIAYCGLSLFDTVRGSYTGNVIAAEDIKRKMIQKFVSKQLLDDVITALASYFSVLFSGTYKGTFGVDMMIVAKEDGNGFMLHPCVEINLRQTMGHVANRLFNNREEIMRIEHNVNYKLIFEYTDSRFVKTI